MGFKKNLSGEITVFLVTEQRIKELNRKFFHKNRPTDVISFDISKNKKEILADIFISVDTAIKNAVTFKTSCLYELCLYAVHGVLHILGYDDRAIRKKELMHKKESEILQCLSIRPRQ